MFYLTNAFVAVFSENSLLLSRENPAFEQGHSWYWTWRNHSETLFHGWTVIPLTCFNTAKARSPEASDAGKAKKIRSAVTILDNTSEGPIRAFLEVSPSACNRTCPFEEDDVIAKIFWNWDTPSTWGQGQMCPPPQ